jgi:hypothetical protein
VQAEPSAGNEHFDDGESSKLDDDSQPPNPADEPDQTATL